MPVNTLTDDIKSGLLDSECAVASCGEYKHYNKSVVGAIEGRFANYRDSGFYVDLNND